MYFINGPTVMNHLKITRNDVSCEPAVSILRVLCVFTLSFFARKFMVSPLICKFQTFIEDVSANMAVNDIMSGE